MGTPALNNDKSYFLDEILKRFLVLSDIFGLRIVFMMKGGELMRRSLPRTGEEIEAIYLRHVDTVYRVCFSYMKNKWDTEDAVQTTFLKLITNGKVFSSTEHEKAWLIVTAGNVCKNLLKKPSRRLDDIASVSVTSNSDLPQIDETLQAILALPERYKTALYLHYYEGYPTKQIAALLRRPHSTIRNHLSEARTLLKHSITEEDHEE